MIDPTENGEEHSFPIADIFLTSWKTIVTSVFCSSPANTSLVHRHKKGHCTALTNIKQSSLSLWMQFVKTSLFSGLSSDSQPPFPSCSLSHPSQGLSAAPFLPPGLVCFFCTCVALSTQKQFCLAWCQAPHSPGNRGKILPPLIKPWHVPSPTLIMELRLWVYSCCQAQFHAWPNINYAWSDVLGLRCSPLICHSHFLPHLARATISVQFGGKPYTDNSRLSGSMKIAKILQQHFFPEFSLPYIFFSGKMYPNGVVWMYKYKLRVLHWKTIRGHLQCSVWQGWRQGGKVHLLSVLKLGLEKVLVIL